jgi:putative PEP-CTERM system histidine kinase
MDADWLTEPAAWSYGVAALAFLAFAFQLSARWRGDWRSSLVLGFVVFSAFWAATTLMFVALQTPAMWFSARLFDALRMLFALAFLSLILGLGRRAGPDGVRYPLKAVLLAVGAGLTVAAFSLGAPLPGAPLRPGWSAIVFAPLLSIAVFGLVLTEQVYRRTDVRLRWNARPLVLAYVAVFVFDLVLYADAQLFHVVDPQLWAARGAVHALAIPLLAVAAVRNPEWSFGIALSRGVLAGSTALLLAGGYLLSIAAVGYLVRYVGGSWGKVLATVLVTAGALLLLLITLSETFRAKVRVLVAKNFLAYRYDYREEWLRFTRRLSVLDAGETLDEACVGALASLVESPGGALWLRREDGRYEPTSGLPAALRSATDVTVAADGALVEFMRRTGWVIDIDEARRDPAKYQGLTLPDCFTQLRSAWLIVPLPVVDELIGFVVLHQPRVRLEINWEVLDLLRTAGRQASSYLAHMQATDALLEARKFDAFNRMSAFVVHDLKNLVAQLQLLLRNAERHRGNPDFQRDMLGTVAHTVERMNQMMRQLHSGTAPVESPRAVDIVALVRRVQAARSATHPGLELQATDCVIALGHEERLERVIGHLVQNALDAAGEAGRVVLRVEAEGDDAIVEICDEGPGMEPEFVRERLFRPFESTKNAGMGIGAYESQQYVRGLGGRIDVDSAIGKGTTVRLVLKAPAVRVLEGAGQQAHHDESQVERAPLRVVS